MPQTDAHVRAMIPTMLRVVIPSETCHLSSPYPSVHCIFSRGECSIVLSASTADDVSQRQVSISPFLGMGPKGAISDIPITPRFSGLGRRIDL